MMSWVTLGSKTDSCSVCFASFQGPSFPSPPTHMRLPKSELPSWEGGLPFPFASTWSVCVLGGDGGVGGSVGQLRGAWWDRSGSQMQPV